MTNRASQRAVEAAGTPSLAKRVEPCDPRSFVAASRGSALGERKRTAAVEGARPLLVFQVEG